MDDITLSAETLTRTLLSVGLEPHAMFRAAIGWLNPDETTEAEHRARDELTAARLAGVGGPTDDALDWLACLSRAPVEYLAVLTQDQLTTSTLVAGHGRHAIVATRVRTSVRIRRIPNEHLAETLLDQLPVVPPARGSTSVRIADLTPAAHARLLQQAIPTTAPDVERLRRTATQPAIRNGELYAAVRDPLGRYHIDATHPVTFRDTSHGRTLVHHDDHYITLTPATRETLLHRLHTAHDAATEQRGR